MGFGAKTPTVPPPPPPPPVPAQAADSGVQDAGARQAALAAEAAGAGFGGTLTGSPEGLGRQASTQPKQLLGY